MRYLEDIKEMLCKELEEIAEKGELSAGALDTLHKITDTIKNIDKIEMLEGEGGYSEDGGMMPRRNYSRGPGYDGGSSYNYDDGDYSSARRGQHYVRGHYSRDGGSSYAGDSSYARDGRGSNRGGYSRIDGKEDMMNRLREMMNNAENEK